MRLSIIVIGDEILLGQVTDTNSGFISRTLGQYGWETARVVTVADKADDIHRAIEICMADSELVITTGGLGPTKDDITKGVMCDIFGGPMIFDREVAANIREVFDLRGLKMNPLTESQAMVPTSCRVIQNRLGTAPIMWFDRKSDHHVLIAMPGVPFETEGMLVRTVAGEIASQFAPDTYIDHKTLMITGITESALAERLEDFEAGLPTGLHLAYLPTPGLIRLRLDARGTNGDGTDKVLDKAYERLCNETGPYIIYTGDANAAEIAIHAIRSKGLHLASAESCTGGNIAHMITSTPGCSDIFLGSVVSYSNCVKTGVLGVESGLIERHGAVSSEVVAAMAEGVARLTGAECAIATSGIAGPGGATDGKPVGTVWTAVLTPKGTETFVRRYPGNRQRVIDRASTEALLAIAKKLEVI